MSSYTKALYQIVFATKHRKKIMIKPGRDALYDHITGILVNKKCWPVIVNGVEDHLHIICYLHQSQSVSELVKSIKISSSKWIKEEGIFPDFECWQIGYGAFTYSMDALENLKKYVENQEKHHAKKQSKDEMIEMLETFDVEYAPEYLE
ncbi:MAG: transposase [Fluviicola sp.]|nr:transposase [Fluviicola sp.]